MLVHRMDQPEFERKIVKVRLTHAGRMHVDIDELTPDTWYTVKADWVEAFDSWRAMEKDAQTAKSKRTFGGAPVTPLIEVSTDGGQTWSDSGGRLDVSMGQTADYRIRLKACRGLREVHAYHRTTLHMVSSRRGCASSARGCRVTRRWPRRWTTCSNDGTA